MERLNLAYISFRKKRARCGLAAGHISLLCQINPTDIFGKLGTLSVSLGSGKTRLGWQKGIQLKVLNIERIRSHSGNWEKTGPPALFAA
jgi:hypothetical protein